MWRAAEDRRVRKKAMDKNIVLQSPRLKAEERKGAVCFHVSSTPQNVGQCTSTSKGDYRLGDNQRVLLMMMMTTSDRLARTMLV